MRTDDQKGAMFFAVAFGLTALFGLVFCIVLPAIYGDIDEWRIGVLPTGLCAAAAVIGLYGSQTTHS